MIKSRGREKVCVENALEEGIALVLPINRVTTRMLNVILLLNLRLRGQGLYD